MYSTSERAQTVKQCLTCGADFSPSLFRPDQKYCSTQCAAKGKYAAGSPHQYTCEQCGKVYQAKHKDRSKFCSRECSFAWARANGGFNQPQRKPRPVPKPMPACEVCGNPVKRRGNKTCSRECNAARTQQLARQYWESKSQRDRQPRACRECGTVFVPEYGDLRRTFCSKQCHKRWAHRNRRRLNGNFNEVARKRLRAMFGDEWKEHYEPINKRKVFERDKWRCQLCGCKIRRTTEWEPRQATIDHIVPLSLGGDHKYSNAQACCMECNSKKGATVQGQQRLFG